MPSCAYTVLLEEEPDVGGFTVTVPAIPEIVTEGNDEGEALAMAAEAIRLSLAYAVDKGIPLPGERGGFRLATVGIESPAPAPASA